MRRIGILLAIGLAGAATANAATPGVTVTPAMVEAGSPELIRVSAPEAEHVEGEWLGRKIDFFAAERNGLLLPGWTWKRRWGRPRCTLPPARTATLRT